MRNEARHHTHDEANEARHSLRRIEVYEIPSLNQLRTCTDLFNHDLT